MTYKATDLKKPGTYDYWVKYEKMGKNTIDLNATTFNYMSNTYGIKGWEFGTDYVFAKNARAAFWYAKLSPYDKNAAGSNFDYNNAYTLALFFNF